MNPLALVMLIFAVLGALDRIFGSRLGLGREFERGFMLLGPMALSMIGMIVLAPAIANLLAPFFDWIYTTLGLDPSIIPASLFANDMGGTAVGLAVMRDATVGYYNALIVSTMMGCTISFTLPFAIGVVEPRQHNDLLFGMLCGVATIPLGCLIGGLFTGIALGALLLNLLPLLLLAALTVLGLIFFPDVSVKVFHALAWVMNAMITVGLMLGAINVLAGREVIAGLSSIEEAGTVCLNAAISLAGAFPLMFVISKLLKRPLALLGGRLSINDASAAGFLSTIVSSTPTFGNMCFMDGRGVVLNAAFAVSAAFTLGGHLAFTLAYGDGCPFDAVTPMIVGKLLAGVAAVALALLLLRGKKPDEK